jgi:uncharacterized damage-inducible protein DinB
MQAQTKQTTIADSILMEMDQEAEITRRLFNVIPEDKLDWRPHPKARTLGELAIHVAVIPSVAEIAQPDTFEMPEFLDEPAATSRAQILEVFADALKKGKEIVASTDDTRAMGEWKLMKGDTPVMAMPRVGVWRMIMLNHYYHHRGQLSAYLRELDVPIPSIYGPSADESPFG